MSLQRSFSNRNPVLRPLPLLCFLSACLVGPATALEDDSEQPVYIEANTAFYDKKTDRSTYTGDVVLIQGSLHLKSDKLVAYSPGGRVEKVIAYGDPVRFRQTPKPGEEEIHGTSKQAEYYVDQDLIILIDNAIVHQGQNEYASDRIEYDQINDVIKAGEASSDTKRVKIILHPKTEEPSDSSTSQTKQ